ncbi:MAG: 16S rRNA (cytidine(1402)-2'-O)-methyltransferase [Defluviitaleaceae bacterium]|nr:16S rRNA (cytidine(1402)-2'-O)-methyltransferase [Defluviitaleaceae bacterium]
MLFICGLPIGNLEDVTQRSLRLMREADFIAAEDTRRTLALMNVFGIKTPLISYHSHNSRTQTERIAALLHEGKNVALVTDAGMPCISDPGAELVARCYEENISVSVAPGPSACVTAVALSGFPSDGRFVFEGFLPPKKNAKKERQKRLAGLAAEQRMVVIYESPHKLAETLADLASCCSGRRAAVVREMTKIYEEVLRGSIEEIAAHYESNAPRGEFVIVLDAVKENAEKQKEEIDAGRCIELVTGYISDGDTQMDAIKKTARILNAGKREAYDIWVGGKKK